MASYKPVTAALRVLEVLDAVSGLQGNATVGKIYREIGIDKATIVRMLETLIHAHYVVRDRDEQTYQITGKSLALSAGFDRGKALGLIVSPLLDNFCHENGWPSLFAIFDQDANKFKKSKSLMESKLFKFDKQIEEKIKSSHDENIDYYANIGASFRFLNPYNIKEPIVSFFKVNLHHFYELITRNRRIKTQNYLLNSIIISCLILFSSIIGFNIPQYIKNVKIVNGYQKVVQKHENIKKILENKSAVINKVNSAKQRAEKVLGKKDEFAGLIMKTPSLVPSGIEISKIEYKKENFAVFYGQALSDIDLNTFLENLKKTIGKSELTTMNESEISIYKGDNVIQNQGEETSNSNQSLKSSTIKAKSFSIKIDLSNT